MSDPTQDQWEWEYIQLLGVALSEANMKAQQLMGALIEITNLPDLAVADEFRYYACCDHCTPEEGFECGIHQSPCLGCQDPIALAKNISYKALEVDQPMRGSR